MFRPTQLEIDQIKKKLSDGNSRFENGKLLVEVNLSDLNTLLDLTYKYERDWNGTCEVLSKANELIKSEEELNLKYYYGLNSILNLNDTNTLEDAYKIARKGLES